MIGVYEAGIDTARFLFRLDAKHDQARARAFCPDGRGREKIAGLDLLYSEGNELLIAAGRPVQALDRVSTALLPAPALADAHEAVKRQLRSELGLHYLGDEGLSRADVTATYRLASPAMGWALMRGVHAVDAPRRKPVVYGRPPETVELLGTGQGRRVLERVYDHGVKHGTAAPGLEVRFEAQTTYRTGRRRGVAEWRPTDVRDTFAKRFGPMQAAAEGLRVASEPVLRETIATFVTDGKITARQAELLLGHIASESVGIARASRTRYRRKAELRRLGLAHALDGAEPIDVALQDVLSDLVGAGAWGA